SHFRINSSIVSSSLLTLHFPPSPSPFFFSFFFNDTATTEIYTLSLHDALPILNRLRLMTGVHSTRNFKAGQGLWARLGLFARRRSEEHTSELQSRGHLVCRLLLEKKKKMQNGRDQKKATLKNVVLTVFGCYSVT